MLSELFVGSSVHVLSCVFLVWSCPLMFYMHFAACVLVSSRFVLGSVSRSLITPVLMPALFCRLHFGLWTYRPQLLIIKARSFFCLPASALWQMKHLTDDGAILSPGQQRRKDPSPETLEHQQEMRDIIFWTKSCESATKKEKNKHCKQSKTKQNKKKTKHHSQVTGVHWSDSTKHTHRNLLLISALFS